MTSKILIPTCNLDTVKDGRGGIFTWLPDKPILEFNMLYFREGKTRGFHYHPHFDEYLLVVEGSGVLVTRTDVKSSKTENFITLNKGTCIKTEKNIYHTVYAITKMTIVAMLTKRWDDCDPPIVRVDE
jgi:mannose-6-phosphate isomerase-like protein (cupin superfamily)